MKSDWNQHSDWQKCPLKRFLSRRIWGIFVFSYSCFSVPALGCLWVSTCQRRRIGQRWRSLQIFRRCTANLKNHKGKETLSRTSKKYMRPNCDHIHQIPAVLNSKRLDWGIYLCKLKQKSKTNSYSLIVSFQTFVNVTKLSCQQCSPWRHW